MCGDTVSTSLHSAHGQNSPGPHHFWSSHSCCLVLYSLLYLSWNIADHRLVKGKGDLISLCSRDQEKLIFRAPEGLKMPVESILSSSLTISHYQKVKGRSRSSGHCGIPLVAGWRPEPVINAKGQSRQSNQYSVVPRLLITAMFNLLFLQEAFEREGREWMGSWWSGDLAHVGFG